MITISVFILSAVICGLLTRAVREFAIAHNVVFGPGSSRHIHSRPIPRLGGVAIFVVVACVLPVVLQALAYAGVSAPASAHYLLPFVMPAAIVFMLGLLDDLRGVDARVKLFVEAVAATLLWIEGIRVRQLPILFGDSTLQTAISLGLTVLWVLWITNAFNLIDGLDGLAAGSALFSTIVICIVSLLTGNGSVAFITIALAGAIAGFLRYNFNPASIFLGDCGSLFIGFLLSAIAIRGSQKGPTLIAVAIPVVSLGLPILDVAVSVVRRFLSRKPLFKPDQEHIHHKLLRRGLSHRQTVLLLYGVSAGFGILSLVLISPGGRLPALILVVIGLVVFVGLQQLRYHEMNELGRLVRRTVAQRQIIANNLAIRRAAEELSGCEDLASIMTVLRAALEPIGFCGFTIHLSTGVANRVESMFAAQYQALEAFWFAGSSLHSAAWTLSLRIEHDGINQGTLMVHRSTSAEVLPMDVNLFTTSGLTKALGNKIAQIGTATELRSSADVPLAASVAAAR